MQRNQANLKTPSTSLAPYFKAGFKKQKLEKTTKKSSTLEFKGVTRIPAKYSPFVRAAASLR